MIGTPFIVIAAKCLSMRVWFVSRHPGAVTWAKNQNIQADYWVPHLSVDQICAGDIVMGVLPVHLAAEVCARGARYFNLSIDLPYTLRGKELNEDDLLMADARLEEFKIISKGVSSHDKV